MSSFNRLDQSRRDGTDPDPGFAGDDVSRLNEYRMLYNQLLNRDPALVVGLIVPRSDLSGEPLDKALVRARSLLNPTVQAVPPVNLTT